MNKFKHFCKKPLLIVSICLIALFFIANVVMICIPHGKVYEVSYKQEGVTYNYKITLGKTYKGTHTYVVDGYKYDVGDVDKKEYDYSIDNGKLYLIDDGTSKQKQEIGTIDSRKIKLNFNVFGDDDKTVLTCKINDVLTTIFLVGLYTSIILLVVSIVVICVDKNKIKTKNKGE